MLTGFFKKIAVADIIGIVVNTIFNDIGLPIPPYIIYNIF